MTAAVPAMGTRSWAWRAAVLAMGTRSRAGRATHRDLRRARAATPKATKKKVPAAASVGAGIQKRKSPAGASEEEEGKTLSEATEILKLKKEALGACRLWKEMRVPGALERYVKAREEEARAEEAQQPKKRKMVLKTKVPEAVINAMKLQPYRTEPRSDEDLANQTELFRGMYKLVRFVDDKMNAYEQALIDQHDSKGYAEDETEVTDDDELEI